jgi:hypothetical protein
MKMRAVQYRQLARSVAAIRTRAVCLCLVAASALFSTAKAEDFASVRTEQAPPSPSKSSDARILAQHSQHADFQKQAAPGAVKQIADWVVNSGDNHSLPFVILHKPEAKVFVFDKDGHLKGTASVLVGLTPGDDSVSGIGTMPLTSIDPDMRTTPAGRFVSTLGHDLGKLDVLWVDYPDAISLHRVINTDPAERRLERIVSPAPLDHRISYGCINVPAKFFDTVVDPTFKDTKGIVYILPEVKSIREVFPGYYDVNENSGPLTADVSAPASQ